MLTQFHSVISHISVIHLLRYIGRSWQHMALGHAAAVTSHMMTETNMFPVTDVKNTKRLTRTFVAAVKIVEPLLLLPDTGTIWMQMNTQRTTFSAQKAAERNLTAVIFCTQGSLPLEGFAYVSSG